VSATAEVIKDDASKTSSMVNGGASADVGDEVQRGREDSVNTMSFFPKETELKKKEGDEPSVILEEDNVREE